MAFNNEDILNLAKAGFTAQQIAALSVVQPAPAPVQTPAAPAAPVAPAASVAPVQLPDGSGVMVAPIATTAPQASIESVLASINGLSQQMQQGFINQSQQPAPVTAEDILAEIINPPTKK